MADVLVRYSLELRPGQQFAINTTPLADELTLAVYAEAVKAGAHVLVNCTVPGTEELSTAMPPMPSSTTSPSCASSSSRPLTPC